MIREKDIGFASRFPSGQTTTRGFRDSLPVPVFKCIADPDTSTDLSPNLIANCPSATPAEKSSGLTPSSAEEGNTDFKSTAVANNTTDATPPGSVALVPRHDQKLHAPVTVLTTPGARSRSPARRELTSLIEPKRDLAALRKLLASVGVRVHPGKEKGKKEKTGRRGQKLTKTISTAGLSKNFTNPYATLSAEPTPMWQARGWCIGNGKKQRREVHVLRRADMDPRTRAIADLYSTTK